MAVNGKVPSRAVPTIAIAHRILPVVQHKVLVVPKEEEYSTLCHLQASNRILRKAANACSLPPNISCNAHLRTTPSSWD